MSSSAPQRCDPPLSAPRSFLRCETVGPGRSDSLRVDSVEFSRHPSLVNPVTELVHVEPFQHAAPVLVGGVAAEVDLKAAVIPMFRVRGQIKCKHIVRVRGTWLARRQADPNIDDPSVALW